MKRAMRFQDARMRPLLNSRNQCQQLSQEYMLYKVGQYYPQSFGHEGRRGSLARCLTCNEVCR